MTLSELISVIATVGTLTAAIAAYFAAKESAKARRTATFLDFYNSLINLQQNWAANQEKIEEEPRIWQQLLNHYEVFAHLYNLGEIDRELAESLLKDYLIGEFDAHRDKIEVARKIDPTAYSALINLIENWKAN